MTGVKGLCVEIIQHYKIEIWIKQLRFNLEK